MNTFYLILVFLFGLIFGSFANVCIYRLPINKNLIFGRSFCTDCKKKINWYDNIPLISFILLGGKCRSCKKKISIEYLFIELISGLIFLLLYLNFDNLIEILFLQIIFIIILIIFFVDLRHFIIPDSLNYTLIFLAFMKIYLPNFESNFTYDLDQFIVGGIAGYLIIWLIIFLYKKLKNIEAMGFGDAKLMAAIGCFFGWYSIPFVIFTSSLLALIIAIPSLVSKKKNLKTAIPFGPYIILTSIIYFLFGGNIYKILIF